MKKGILMAIALSTTLFLSACGSFDKKNTSETTKTSETTSSSHSSEKKEHTKKEMKMNFEQIKTGDFQSLMGNWTEIKWLSRNRVFPGREHTLAISNTTIKNGDMITLTSAGISTPDGMQKAVYTEQEETLIAGLENQSVPINWGIYFYPIGTTERFKNDESAPKNTKNIIVVWTSNNQFIQVFAEDNDYQLANAPKSSASKLNFAQLSNGELSSLKGTWTSSSGKKMVLAGNIESRPENSPIIFDKGMVVENTLEDGYSTVITPGALRDGYMIGSIGTFNPKSIISAFAPLMIIPKGIKASEDDDSDSTRDRFIIGGGQSGFADSAYYRE